MADKGDSPMVLNSLLRGRAVDAAVDRISSPWFTATPSSLSRKESERL